jgi:hypothetical protein
VGVRACEILCGRANVCVRVCAYMFASVRARVFVYVRVHVLVCAPS